MPSPTNDAPPAETGEATPTASADNTSSLPALKTVTKSTIEYKSDLRKGSHAHSSGILHATQHSSTAREEHCFAWLASTSHHATAMNYLSQFGFNHAVFIPYSSKRRWMERYPTAVPHVHIDVRGKCTGFPYWHAPHPDEGAAAGVVTGRGAGPIETTTTKKRGRPKIKKKLFASALLSHSERDILHIQIYKYFAWLRAQLIRLEEETAGKRLMSRVGISSDGVGAVLEEMAEGFRAVSHVRIEEEKGEHDVDGDGDGSVPFLEEGLVTQLERMEQEAAKNQVDDGDGSMLKKRRTIPGELDFDEMFGRLVRFREIYGHVNVSHRYKGDIQLAQWVSNLRSKKKAWIRKQQEELDEQLTAADENDGETPKKECRGRRQYLDQEKVDKLDSVGFTWSFERNGKSWEERFQDLIAFRREHGHCRVPRKEALYPVVVAFAFKVHKQRRQYKLKDKSFMKYRYNALREAGFDFRPRNVDVVPWNAGFEELVAFGRLNGHYNVPCPIPGNLNADRYNGDDEQVSNAFRLYKWVKRILNEYPAYSSGKSSRLLNEERVRQLTDIGFEFN
eukprot:CCRYP_013671-RA/>CCRYP_013671-RA protein AED:0.05 eAED:0.05 QI:161/0.66/0.5/1/1/1/4/672/562